MRARPDGGAAMTVAGPVVRGAEAAALPRPRTASRRRRRASGGWRTGVQAVLIAAWCLLPVYWLVAASFRPFNEVFATTPFPADATWDDYRTAFRPLALLGPALLHSLGLSAGVTGVVLLLSVTGGYAVTRFRFRGAGVLRGALLAGTLMPAVTIVTPLFAVMHDIGWSNTFQAIFVPDVALALPLAVFVLGTALQELPWELEDAALTDGCSRAQAFVRVMLPIMAPAIVTVALLTFIATWNEYLVALLLSTPDTVLVTVVVANFATQITGTAATMAAGVVAMLPPLLLTVAFQRRITAGLTAGGVKG